MKLLIGMLMLLAGCTQGHDTNPYAYGPSIILVDGTYYAYYCSAGANGSWDDIRMATSKDGGATWGGSIVVQSGPGRERCACDPSVVHFKGYYYLFYGGNLLDTQGIIYVSRGLTPQGPFEKYSSVTGWGNYYNPTEIIRPAVPTLDGPNALYGAGQPTVVVVGDELYQWYTDTTYDPTGRCTIMFTKSSDGIIWTTPIATNYPICSSDVKLNKSTGKFNVFGLNGAHGPNVTLMSFESADGITWDLEHPLIQKRMPAYSNNLGVSGDAEGALVDHTFVGFGAPRDLNPFDVWAQWDLFIQFVGTDGFIRMVKTE